MRLRGAWRNIIVPLVSLVGLYYPHQFVTKRLLFTVVNVKRILFKVSAILDVKILFLLYNSLFIYTLLKWMDKGRDVVKVLVPQHFSVVQSLGAICLDGAGGVDSEGPKGWQPFF